MASESSKHQELKRLSALWARQQGYSCCGMEIALPNSGYRADVAAYKPATALIEMEFGGKRQSRKGAAVGTTAVFECKQFRADLLNDSCLADKTTSQLRELAGRRATLERLLRVHLPSAANGESLFSEYDTYNFEAQEHKV